MDEIITLREVTKKFRGSRPGAGQPSGELLALDSVDFSGKRGRFYGVIGSNGAGKTTLLRVMAGLTRPSSGTVRVRGKSAVVLNLGDGLFPPYSGVDNIFLYGALLGMSEQQLKDSFDSIVEFSGLGAAIFEPVRTYSQGMVLRLGFSVAMAQSPQILLLDEAMQVGDMEFQSRCLSRIQKYRAQGVTIIHATHDCGRLEDSADEIIWLENGRIQAQGPPYEVIAKYVVYQQALAKPREAVAGPSARASGGEPSEAMTPSPPVCRISLRDDLGMERTEFEANSLLDIRIEYSIDGFPGRVSLTLWVERDDGLQCFGVTSAWDNVYLRRDSAGNGEISFRVSSLSLNPGSYRVFTAFIERGSGRRLMDPEEVATFRVRFGGRKAFGLFLPEYRWIGGAQHNADEP